MQLTAERILEDVPGLYLSDSGHVTLNIKYGFDGSGSHAIYHQVNNESTNNIIMTMFCPLSILNKSGEIIWQQKSPNHPLIHRPLALQMGKESTESLQSLTVFNKDIDLLKSTGCHINIHNQDISMMVNIQSHMMDRKALNLFLGLGGAYCDL